MQKQQVFARILAEFHERLARLPEEQEAAMEQATPENRPFMEQAFDNQRRSLEAGLAEAQRVLSPAARPQETVGVGSLIRVRLEFVNRREEWRWWLILPALYGRVGPITIEGEVVTIESGTYVSDSLLGSRVGDRAKYLMAHGDNRDVIDAIVIEEIL